jgi:hypothetical protein
VSIGQQLQVRTRLLVAHHHWPASRALSVTVYQITTRWSMRFFGYSKERDACVDLLSSRVSRSRTQTSIRLCMLPFFSSNYSRREWVSTQKFLKIWADTNDCEGQSFDKLETIKESETAYLFGVIRGARLGGQPLMNAWSRADLNTQGVMNVWKVVSHFPHPDFLNEIWGWKGSSHV